MTGRHTQRHTPPVRPVQPASGSPGPVIDWRIPAGAPDDWLYGAGATRAERGIVNAAAAIGVGLFAWYWLTGRYGWAWWQYALGAALAIDLFGGAVANALGAAKRQYFGPPRSPESRSVRLLRNPVAFAAFHLHPLLVAWAYGVDALSWWWAAGMYAAATVGSILVEAVPPYLARPTAMLVFVGAVVALGFVPAPPGWGWLPAVFLAKLVLAHAVREEPYRPAPGT